MINENAINKTTLMNHFSGNSTPLQKKLIEDWLAAPENVEYYYECLDEWESDNTQFIANDSLAFKKVLHTTDKEESISEKVSTVMLLSKKLAIAAAILVIIGGACLLGKDAFIYKTIATNFGEIKQITLPDGSTVALNSVHGLFICFLMCFFIFCLLANDCIVTAACFFLLKFRSC